MRRISGLVAVVFSAAFVFLFVSGREAHSATLHLGNYNNPDSPTMSVVQKGSSSLFR